MKSETLNILRDMRVGVLFGGLSNEREVSLKTGKAVIESLKAMGVPCVGIDAGRDLAERITKEKINLAFIALHGRYGEDGCVQGLLELMGVPYTGSGVAASAIAMSKKLTKAFCASEGVLTAPFEVVERKAFMTGKATVSMTAPCVVKPVNGGSSLNVSICMKNEEITPALKAAFSGDPEALVERFIAGKLITVGVIGGKPLPVIEVETRSGFYDYFSKYSAGSTVYHIPARVDKSIQTAAQAATMKIHKAIGARGQTRSELIVDETGQGWFLELNTIPGMTQTSLLPKAAANVGMTFHDLVLEIIGEAIATEQGI